MEVYEFNPLFRQGEAGRTRVMEGLREMIAETPGGLPEEDGQALARLAADYAYPDVLRLLFKAGVSPAAADRFGFTLLHHLARQEESRYTQKPAGAVAETAELLLEHGVSVLGKDKDKKMTCYHYAARNGLSEIVTVLAAHSARLGMTDEDGNTAIHIACEYVGPALHSVKFAQDDERDAALQKAEDYFLTVKAFVQGGVDKDEKNRYGQTALDLAVKNGAKKIAAYLAGGVSDETFAAGGMTLHQAAEKGDVEAIRALADSGADLNGLSDAAGKGRLPACTPLAVACAFLSYPAVETLLECGADPSFKDGLGRIALAYIFNDRQVSPHLKLFEDKSIPKMIKDMLAAGLSIDEAANDDGDTLLTLACGALHGGVYNRYTLKGAVVEELLKTKADINRANRFGVTPLMLACAQDFDIMENVQITLLERGANVGAADRDGNTALHYAARSSDNNGAKSLCEMLLEFGAYAGAVNNRGETALDLATQAGNEPLVKLLLSKIQ